MCPTEFSKINRYCQENSLVNGSYLKTNVHIVMYERSLLFVDKRRTHPRGNTPPSPRSEIREFSKNSRKRLLRLFSKIKLSSLSFPVFLTLTYHHGYKSSPKACKQHLNTFLQFLRDNYPSVVYIWRLELQKRGAPHFHFILFALRGDQMLLKPSFEREINKAWHRIADPSSKAHLQYGCKFIPISNFKMCFSYVSKYCAKESTDPLLPGYGRRWGFSSSLPIDPLVNIELPVFIYSRLKRLCRKLYRKRARFNKRIFTILKSNTSFLFFIDSHLSYRLLNCCVDMFLDLQISPIQKSMFIEYALNTTQPSNTA